MLEGVLKAKTFCDRHSEAHPDLQLTEDEWTDIIDLTEALTPARITTNVLQAEQLTLGDFYGAWLTCKFKTKKLEQFATSVVEAMDQREKICYIPMHLSQQLR